MSNHYLNYADSELSYLASEPINWYAPPFKVQAWRARPERAALICVVQESSGNIVVPLQLTVAEAMSLARGLLGAVDYVLGGVR